MPVYTVTLRINVPTLGERIVDFPLINAPNIEEAIRQARGGLVSEAIKVEKTA